MSTLFPSTPQALTLSQLNAIVGNALRMRPDLQQTWVTAELSDVRTSGGHCYMELVEKNDTGQTVAKIRANIWSNTFRTLHHKFLTATGRPVASGLKVMVCGSVTYHPVYGLSFNISDIDPSYTLGDIERLRREILERLAREGIADANKHHTLPPDTQRIAVISAAGAAGYGDFCNQLNGNAEGFIFYPHLFPAVLQGERTAPSVMAALEEIEMTIDLWDAVVIIRGGGATTDLIGFDNYDLARRVATFPLPVIVGIGHERDNTVLDYLAHTRCKTPTAVAEFLVNHLRESARTVAGLVNSIVRYSTERLKGESQRVSALGSMAATLASAAIARENTRLTALSKALPPAVSTCLSMTRRHLDATMTNVVTISGSRIRMERQRLDNIPATLTACAAMISRREHDRLLRLGSLLDVLSPEATLKRGYSITSVDGHAITSADGLTPGTTVTTRLASGTLTSTISEIKNPNHDQ